MTRPIVATIDLQAFKANYALAKKFAGDALCVAVIKANGYGHGICEVAKALPDSTLAVACVDEAMLLRNEGIDNPVVVLEGAFTGEELAFAAAHKLQLIVHADYQIEQLAQFQHKDAVIDVWLKLNTGMNRLGFSPAISVDVLTKLKALTSVHVVGVMTHFSSADEIDKAVTEQQLALFRSAVHEMGVAADGLLLTAANSAALIEHKATRLDCVRPGVMLYGSSPLDHLSSEAMGLKAVMSLQSRIMAIHEIEAGDCVGYAGTWRASRTTKIGTIAAGYGDGYPRHAETGTPVWIGDRVVPLIGRVSMDMLSVDLSYHPEVNVGDEVELWGKNISVDEVAKSAGTISYELLTGVTARVPRRYVS
ncbi:alanine racemase [Alkalimarinus alittae]|uniref:Alanine racemase n=1 Tax=Alkalimarinus alittae TaxID=2961619 RepID=A0ABY6N482_9ALTE|nr:alanine racemase [Alkalimarinus alittae]UZE96901.1 alanine racemase [Alkalimarinus alittae]